MLRSRPTSTLGIVAVAAALLSACSSSGSAPTRSSSPGSSGASSRSGSGTAASSTSGSTTVSSPSPSSSPSALVLRSGYYVSLGDSYAAGYQPTGPRAGATTENGFAYQVVRSAAASGHRLTLVNFGCSGATTASVLHSIGCPHDYLGPGATPYDGRTQASAAEAFLRAHRGQIALITVSIGGNDITVCGINANPTSCLLSALSPLKTNLATLVSGLRAAAGPAAPLVGITYPDVLLGNLLSKESAMQSVGKLSVFAFQSLINPALKAAYEAVGGRFADVTTATGAYEPLTDTTSLPPYGTVPVAVAKICQLTYYCQYHDIHPRTPGYAIIADLVLKAVS
ncbi:MAG: hypothetical protein J0H43_03530 [Actinobacteria bacterium]|nr:hypothetical protein [Actinomycetota bacterium]